MSDVVTRCAPVARKTGFQLAWPMACVIAIAVLAAIGPSAAETLPEALVKAYQTNPQLNAERARQRGTDENVPQALAGYRPQIIASLSAGLQAVRNLLPDNTVSSATLRPWTIGVTVSQILYNGNKTANSVRVAEFQVKSGREALRNVGQGVLLDAVTAYTNVLANQAMVESQRANVAVLREIQATTKRRLDAGDVTPTDTAQAEARVSRGLADLNAAEVALAISKETYAQVIGEPPAQLMPASTVDGLSPNGLAAAKEAARHEHPAVLGAAYDVDVAQTTIKVAESSLLPTVSVQASASKAVQTDQTLTTTVTDQASVLGQLNVPIYDGGTAASQTRQAKELTIAEPSGSGTGQKPGANRRRQRLGEQRGDQGRTHGRGGRSARCQRRASRSAARSGGRTADHHRCSQRAAGSDERAREVDCEPARSDHRLLHIAERHRAPRCQCAQTRHAGLSAGSSLPSGTRCLARRSYPVRPIESRARLYA